MLPLDAIVPWRPDRSDATAAACALLASRTAARHPRTYAGPPAKVDCHDGQGLRTAEVVAVTSVCCQVWRDDARFALTFNGHERRGRESLPCRRAAELLSASATWATAKECDCRRLSSVRAVAGAADAF